MSGKRERDLTEPFAVTGDLGVIHVFPSVDVRGSMCLDLEQRRGESKYSVMLRLTKSDVRSLVNRLTKIKPLKRTRGR